MRGMRAVDGKLLSNGAYSLLDFTKLEYTVQGAWALNRMWK